MTDAFATGIDAFAYGEYRPGDPDPVTPSEFAGRITADGSSGFAAEPGRYHLYSAHTSPVAHRLEVLLALNGGSDATVSHVDGLRDARGWAFRAPTGADPVNGFTLLREAYEASRPGFQGSVDVPVLWDRVTGQIVSADATAIGIDLMTQFPRVDGAPALYPIQLAGEIERISAAIADKFISHVGRAVYDREAAADVRSVLRRLDRYLTGRRYLVGDHLTDADVRLWVHLVRYDAGANAHGVIGPALPAQRELWRYARDLYAHPAFASTTDFSAFAAPFAELPPWNETPSDADVTSAA
jgi:putative glutathione S-transferase